MQESKDKNLEILTNIKSENEQKCLSYLMRYPKNAFEVKEEYFLHEMSKAIYYAITRIADENLKFDFDTAHTIAIEKCPFLKWEKIRDIYEKFTDFDNIDFVKTVLKDDYYKNFVSKKIIEDILTHTSRKDFLGTEKLRNLSDEISSLLSREDSIKLLTGEDLARDHKEEIERRNSGIKSRSLGFSDFNRYIDKPGNDGEITILAGLKMSGKSLVVKHIENHLIKKGICVLSLNLEMSQSSSSDRLLCIRNGISLSDLQKKEMSPELKSTIFSGLDELSLIKNYIYCPNEYFDFSLLDTTIQQAKRKFKQLGVLPEDEYIFVVADSLDMFQNMNDAMEIKIGVDKLHSIVRKHNCHFMGLVQAGENKFRSAKAFKKPEDLNRMHLTTEDVAFGSYYAARARVVIMINRPLLLKKRFFPELDIQWSNEEDYLHADIVKVNEGTVGRCTFLVNNLKITPYS